MTAYRQFLSKAFACVFPTLLLATPLTGVDAATLKLRTNQQIIEDLTRQEPKIDMANVDAVFAAVFEALPEKAVVYPTESYYYFSFPYKGIVYAGNIRFDAWDQFDGKVHFAYFPEYAFWRKPLDPSYKKLGKEDGVDVKQIDKLHYTVTFKGKTVAFELPDLSKTKPAPGVVRDDETYIGPIWDESGVKFDLVFNKPSKTFLYVLNDAPKVDQYEDATIPGVTVGHRTSFAFYKDKLADRRILIGVFMGNTQLNNYFDGPFDQLPDNFIEGDALRDALIEVEPSMKGKMDRYGSDPSGEVRYAITTYMYYGDVEDLKPIVDCAAKETDAPKYYACFDAKQPGEDGPEQGDGKGDASGREATAASEPAEPAPSEKKKTK
ncbi:hypothetical protein T281_01985 [Rhodomicrobium udaipurense JA643]|uniref:Uncharacterized protein n=1 Tax=Rhodomicrobium udaipurense TaxID=1202716 RepID=A0A8I1KL29_9HYPH|nr:hypothetical protein [Rhodomicrobium udaipurense]KAI96078.1 hypothetical protein T281_01985 [Rhodomicrobium udaipurense JA643]MBJ7542713.1 hypothetical protein [Rhodomicrobium udaipurense]